MGHLSFSADFFYGDTGRRQNLDGDRHAQLVNGAVHPRHPTDAQPIDQFEVVQFFPLRKYLTMTFVTLIILLTITAIGQ